jgi:hypothetical protein
LSRNASIPSITGLVAGGTEQVERMLTSGQLGVQNRLGGRAPHVFDGMGRNDSRAPRRALMRKVVLSVYVALDGIT